MQHDVIWEPCGEIGFEHVQVSFGDDGMRADGLLLLVSGGEVVRLRYHLRTDAAYCARELRATVEGPAGRHLGLVADGRGAWRGADGARLPDLDGCIDLDIAATPLTNTLPIRRLGLADGESAELLVAYVSVPTLDVLPVHQRYTLLSHDSQGSRYLYEGLDSGFRAEVSVDADGLVTDYADIWRRRWPVSGGTAL